VRVFQADLGEPEQVERLAEFCGDGVEILVNNAGVQGAIGPFAAADLAGWRKVFEINLFAAVRLCRGLIEPMRKRGRGKIVNLSGGGAASPRAGFSAYGASKCALVRFSETLAQELAGTGIDVNCMAPGALNTGMLDEVIAAGPGEREYERAIKQRAGGGASMERAADLAAFLASPASDRITGRLISAVWDKWPELAAHREELGDIYTLRRITPEDRGKAW
jgi:NAD(P)-dependent dehydrogenase (short-subunit alcohol dehydrogenase family)